MSFKLMEGGSVVLLPFYMATALISPNITSNLLGVELDVGMMAMVGSLMALGIAEPIRSRKKMFFTVISAGILGAVMVGILPHIPLIGGFVDWNKIPKPPLGWVFGLAGRWIIQWFINKSEALLDKATGISKTSNRIDTLDGEQ